MRVRYFERVRLYVRERYFCVHGCASGRLCVYFCVGGCLIVFVRLFVFE